MREREDAENPCHEQQRSDGSYGSPRTAATSNGHLMNSSPASTKISSSNSKQARPTSSTFYNEHSHPDVAIALDGSVDLFIELGVATEEILDSDEKILAYFLD